jgi:hypothetical protein
MGDLQELSLAHELLSPGDFYGRRLNLKHIPQQQLVGFSDAANKEKERRE